MALPLKHDTSEVSLGEGGNPIPHPNGAVLVSVVVTTYNRCQLLPSTLDSVFRQTYPSFEVLVVDDGSTDKTDEILTPLSASGKIRYITQKNQGVSAARNAGIAAARGTYLSFLDDDDIWPPDKLAWQVAYMESHPELAIVGGAHLPFSIHLGDALPAGSELRIIAFEEMFAGSPFASPGQALIRTSVLEQSGWFDATLRGVEDIDLYMRIARVGKVAHVPRLALHYRQHPHSLSRNIPTMLENGKKLLNKHLPHLPSAKRKSAKAESSFWLYQYLGKQAVKEARMALSRRCFIPALRHLFPLRFLFLEMLFTPGLGRMFLRDIINVRFKNRAVSHASPSGQVPR